MKIINPLVGTVALTGAIAVGGAALFFATDDPPPQADNPALEQQAESVEPENAERPAPARKAERRDPEPELAKTPAPARKAESPMVYSKYHIDGWLTDYECVANLEGVKDVIQFKRLIRGYEGPGVVKNEWGMPVFRTVEEVGLGDHEMVKRLPNDKWTEVIKERDWPALKAYAESRLEA